MYKNTNFKWDYIINIVFNLLFLFNNVSWLFILRTHYGIPSSPLFSVVLWNRITCPFLHWVHNEIFCKVNRF
jgi:hypothetical protein